MLKTLQLSKQIFIIQNIKEYCLVFKKSLKTIFQNYYRKHFSNIILILFYKGCD